MSTSWTDTTAFPLAVEVADDDQLPMADMSAAAGSRQRNLTGAVARAQLGGAGGITSAPGAGDDSADGYRRGSLVLTDAGALYVCTDATEGAAVWQLFGAGAGDMLASEYDTNDDGTVDSADVAERVEEVVQTDSDSGAAHAFDLAAGTVFQLTLTNDCDLSFTNVPTGGFGITIELIQDGTGGHTVTWPLAVTWAGGTAPTLTTAAAAVDVIALYTPDGGTTWRGFAAGLDFS